MVDISLNPVQESEIGRLLELSENIWLPTFSPLFSEYELNTLYKGMYSREKLKSFINSAGCNMYFIIMDTIQIGYLAVEWRAESLWLDKIYVLIELQGKGIGKHVLNMLENMARERKLHLISLRVNRRNDKAKIFYESQGFHIDASVDYPAPNGLVYDDYLMSKKLL